MKKLIYVFVGLMLLSSCKSKKATRQHTNTNTKRHVKDRAKKPEIKVDNTVVEANYGASAKVEYLTKTTYNQVKIDKLYANQPKLNQSKIAYIKKFNKLAINEMTTYKIPASITLAQGLLESRYGQSVLTKKSKNHFGIKCHKWKGKKVYHDDDAKGECFRKYDYDANSYRDHSLFLSKGRRYKKLFTYAPNDYKSWAKGLRKAGYATDSRYSKKLIDIIETYKLYEFDKFVLGENYKPIANKKKIETVHVVKTGETLYSISGLYFISVRRIKKLNKLKGNIISVGQRLKLVGVKPIKTPKSIKHIVNKGDTLYKISKKYNITVEKIKTLNSLVDDSLSVGQKIIIE